MRLEGDGGTFVDLRVVGYEFTNKTPEPLGFDFDANWLVVDGRASSGDRAWSFQEPCLLTTELRELAAWFDAVAEGSPNLEEIDFTEPCVAFTRTTTPPDRPVIQVAFELEARPPWLSSRPVDYQQFTLDFLTSTDSARLAARELRADLERFPERNWRQK